MLALAAAAVVSGPGPPAVRVEPEVQFALPPTSLGCSGSTQLPGGGVRLPLTVSTVAGQTAESVNVCIGGQGPYPFVLDSGAGESTIDAKLAKRLHLGEAGPSSLFAGVGCTGTARPVQVSSWSMDGVPLDPQQLTAATLPQIGGKGEPDGLLGSDVLGRFGAVRIDFAAGALTLASAEGAPLSGTASYTGPVGAPPTTLTQGEGTTVPLTVSPVAGDISLSVAVRFHDGPQRSFVVDTGSSQSVVASSVARSESLPVAPTWRSARRQCARPSPSRWCTAGAGPCRARRCIRNWWARPTSASSAPAAPRACSAPTSSGATAGSSSTTPGACSFWVEPRRCQRFTRSAQVSAATMHPDRRARSKHPP